MSFMPPIAPINADQTLFSANSLVNIDLDDDSTKKLPKWLIEFNSYSNSTKEPKNLSEFSNVCRPLTDNSELKRPKWFEELSKRRMSNICNMDSSENVSFVDDLFGNKEFERKSSTVSNTDSSIVEFVRTNNFDKPKLSFDFKADEFLYSVNDSGSISSLKLSDSRRSSSNDSKNSLNIQDSDILDEGIFSFTATKSIENLKLFDLSDLDEFVIPEMPSGSELRLYLINNWGDENIIGLNGIEILDPTGNRPSFKNIYLEDSNKCRFDALSDLKKLMDNVYRTHDDSHIWQYQMTKKQLLPLQIVCQFEKPITIALVRIWNYNKSRIHSYRGVKLLQIRLNEKLIFSGEIAKATGDLTGSVENFGDTILFTTNESVLEQISYYDFSFQELLMEQMKNEAI